MMRITININKIYFNYTHILKPIYLLVVSFNLCTKIIRFDWC